MPDNITPINNSIEQLPSDAPEPVCKVMPLGTLTRLDMPVEKVLDNARHLKGIVIMGYDDKDEYHFASSYADGGTVLWLLEKLKQRILD